MNSETCQLRHPLAPNTTVDAGSLWTFPEGLIGVDLRRAALVPLEDAEPFELLCDADGSTFGLVVVDPARLVPDYAPALAPDELAVLGTADPAALRIRVPVTLPGDGQPLCLNLKGPILLSPRERIGVQRISHDESHAIRHTLDLTGSGSTSCSS